MSKAYVCETCGLELHVRELADALGLHMNKRMKCPACAGAGNYGMILVVKE